MRIRIIPWHGPVVSAAAASTAATARTGRPFGLGVVAGEPVSGDQEEDYDYDEGDAEGEGAESPDCAVRVAGFAPGNDYCLDERRLFG